MSVATYNAMLPANISYIIKKRGLKNGVVAELAGFSKQQFSDMLNGRRIIKSSDILAIADALDVPVGDLFKEIA